ncbi:MAG: Adenosylcobinamide-GDP ribazoletransferase [Devosia sp.]|uniref:adenosylcobinamide-GDP ribazoletransferase n=1 Tax=Devosia sp. TaxID=1871048 RepID=UPI00262D5758|nr:adenosylcobinamide-GDP ribazoletransferase [Devosia sp.]MDB5540036.1 Adenosylcobinamide-GDP ribazoletransferase [Devosia sp.]
MSDDTPGSPPRQDNRPPPQPEPERQFSDDLVMGLRFFSRLPTGDRPFERPNLDRIGVGLAFTSLIIGFGPALLMMLAVWIGLPSYFAAALGVAAMLVVTGALPEDAIADSADGLLGGASIERRLEIMKDSRHGTYGVAALGLYLLLRVTAIGAVAAYNPLAAGGIWLASSILARSGCLWLSVDLPNAREGGASAAVGRVSKRAFSIGMGFAVVLAFVLAAPFTSVVAVVLALAAAAGVAAAWTGTCRRLIGGQTGDLIGALHVLIELAVLTVLLIFA